MAVTQNLLQAREANNLIKIFIFSIFIAMFIIAFWANASIFIEEFLTSPKEFKNYQKSLIECEVKGLTYVKKLTAFIFRKNKILLFESIFILLMVQFSLVYVIFTGLTTATSILKVITK